MKYSQDNTGRYITVLAVVALLLVALAASRSALGVFESELEPELHKRAAAVGESVSGLIDKVLGYGVPFERFRDMGAYLSDTLADNPEIAYIAVSSDDGQVLYQAGCFEAAQLDHIDWVAAMNFTGHRMEQAGEFYVTSLPLMFADQRIGNLHVGQATQLIQARRQEIFLDVLTVVLVSILVALELLFFLSTYTLTSPLRMLGEVLRRGGRGDFSRAIAVESRDEISHTSQHINRILDNINQRFRNATAALDGSFQFARNGKPEPLLSANVGYIRPALFLLIFSESLSLSFFPLFVDSLYEPMAGISREMVIGLPISVFMLVWALALPASGNWSDTVGRRRAFMAGALITAVGLLLTALSQSIFDLLLWRTITALGYAVVFITCQGYVTDHTTPANRTRGMAIFLAGFFSGSLCGSAIGGILADRLGYDTTFMLSAVLSLIAALFVHHFIKARPLDSPVVKKRLSLADFRAVMSNKQVLALTLFSAIPAKISLTGFLYYTGPLYLKYLGENQSSIGRILMAYGLAIIFLSPLIGRLIDRFGGKQAFVVAGGFLSASAMFVLYYQPSTLGVIISIGLVGIAHALAVPPQIAIATDALEQSGAKVNLGTGIGIFRLMERAGNVTGPLIAGLLITAYGFEGAFLGIGLITLVSAVLFVFSLIFMRHRAGAKS